MKQPAKKKLGPETATAAPGQNQSAPLEFQTLASMPSEDDSDIATIELANQLAIDYVSMTEAQRLALWDSLPPSLKDSPFFKHFAPRPSKPGKAPRKRGTKKPPVDAFENKQMRLFQDFLCNTEEQRRDLSNAIDLWDNIPRYSVSRKLMTKMRSPEGTLKLLKLEFIYRKQKLKAVIAPARIEVEDDKRPGETKEVDFYPSANEELIEDFLRKFAADQQQGFFDTTEYRSGAVFTLHQLREEMRKHGHTRSFQEITMSLRILARSTIEIQQEGDDDTRFATSPYLPLLVGVTRKHLEADPQAKWMVQFHPLVTHGIDQLQYRQYNFRQVMSHPTYLARWIHKQLQLKFTFAAHGTTFEMHYATIKRESGALSGYSTERHAVKAVDEAFEHLSKQKVLMQFDKLEQRGARNKLQNVIYTLYPHPDFIAEVRAANKRLQLAQAAMMSVDN